MGTDMRRDFFFIMKDLVLVLEVRFFMFTDIFDGVKTFDNNTSKKML